MTLDRKMENMAYKGILPGMGVSGVLVQEVVVRLLHVCIAVAENEARASVVDVAVCVLDECPYVSADLASDLQVKIVASSRDPQYTEPVVSADHSSVEVGVAIASGAYNAHSKDIIERKRLRMAAILRLLAEYLTWMGTKGRSCSILRVEENRNTGLSRRL